MSQVLEDLVDLLTLEPIEENLFRGRSQDLGFRQLFGGQVLGQSLSAASQTVEEARHYLCVIQFTHCSCFLSYQMGSVRPFCLFHGPCRHSPCPPSSGTCIL